MRKRESLYNGLLYGVLEERKVLDATGLAGPVAPVLETSPVPGTVTVRELNIATGEEREHSFVDTEGDQLGSGINLAEGGAAFQSLTVFGGEDRTRISRADITGGNFAAVGQLSFENNDGAGFICSASLIDDFHILTSAHCVADNAGDFYSNFEFESGKDTEDYRYYGNARATFVRFFSEFTPNSNRDHDIAVITLDRNLGTSSNAGHLGFGFNSDNSWFTGRTGQVLGYPRDTPDGSRGTQWQISGDATDYAIATGTFRNTLDNSGGMSGGPLHYGGIIYGVNSFESPTHNGQTRITQGKFEAINDWIAEDKAQRTPTDKADLVSYDRWFNSDFDGLSGTTFAPGDSVNATVNVRNIGTATAGSSVVNYYLSTDTDYDSGDTFIGSSQVGSIGTFDWVGTTGNLQLPSSVAAGQYYITYFVDANGDVDEFTNAESSDLNEGYVNDLLDIVVPIVDDHGNDSSSATLFSIPSPASGNIELGDDSDWFRFSAVAGGQYNFTTILETLSDTTLTLYDTDGTTQLDFDDDGGPERASEILWDAPADGIYYLAVRSFGTNIGTYQLAADVADDHGSDFLTATALPAPFASPGVIATGVDADYFSFSAVAGNQYEFETILGTLSDTTLTLYDTDGTTQLDFDDDGGPALASEISWEAPADGNYYLAVRSFGTNIGTYQLINSDNSFLLGDVNQDTVVDFSDIQPFISLLQDGTFLAEADIDSNGVVDFSDIPFFIDVLAGGGGPQVLLGDVDQNGVVNFSDIPSFISLLQDGTFLDEADIDRNGVVGFSDIPLFIDVLAGGSTTVTSQSILVAVPVGSAVSVAKSESIASVASTAEVPTTEPSLPKNVTSGLATASRSLATAPSAQASLDSVRDLSASPALNKTLAKVTPIETLTLIPESAGFPTDDLDNDRKKRFGIKSSESLSLAGAQERDDVFATTI